MRWVRLRTVVGALFVSTYFIFAHVSTKGSLTAFLLVLLGVMIFGSSLFDRILFDPSAVYIEKPWRLMRPTVGDLFRFVIAGAAAFLTLPLVILRGSFLDEPALFEFGMITFGIALYEAARFYIERVRWHGTAIDVRTKFGRRVSVKWANLKDIRVSRFSNSIVFQDRTGRAAKVSRRLKGFSEFMRDAERYCPPELQTTLRLLK